MSPVFSVAYVLAAHQTDLFAVRLVDVSIESRLLFEDIITVSLLVLFGTNLALISLAPVAS